MTSTQCVLSSALMATSTPRVDAVEEEGELSPPTELQQPQQSFKHRKSYKVAQKLGAISMFDENGGNVAKASRESGVSSGCLQQWLKQRVELQGMRTERTLSIRKRRKCASDDMVVASRGELPEMEARLVECLTSMRQDGVTVSGECMKVQARALFREEFPEKNPEEFKASNGWLYRQDITFTNVSWNLMAVVVLSAGRFSPTLFRCRVREQKFVLST